LIGFDDFCIVLEVALVYNVALPTFCDIASILIIAPPQGLCQEKR